MLRKIDGIDVRQLVKQHIYDLLVEEAGGAATFSDGSEGLHEIGLSSLLMARLVIGLEAVFGTDPFADDVVLSDVRSVDHLIEIYRRAALPAA